MVGSGRLGIIKRQDALSNGLKFFYNGKPCIQGHLSKRFVSNYSCYECSKQRTYLFYKTDEGKKLREIQYKREYKNNRCRYYKNNATRRAVCKNATPKWLTAEQKQDIKRMYLNVPDGCHVDHIVPLKGKNVCGLNVPWNLQYLQACVNLVKGNTFES